ncbi:MAG: LCP family protein [Chroococcales cyanobacterium]
MASNSVIESSKRNRTNPSREQRGRNARRWFLWSLAFLGTATLSALIGATAVLLTPLSSMMNPVSSQDDFVTDPSPIKVKEEGWGALFQYRLARPVHILVMGIDRVPDAPLGSEEMFAGRSDTMLLLRFDPTDEQVRMLSIPRDSRVRIPGVGMWKINDANVEGGPDLAARVVSKTLNDVPIDRYVRVTTGAFRELVDLVGGVEVYVPEPMQYEDKTQKLDIDLEEGWQTLNGDEAEQFARYRNDKNGDIGRVQRQQILLKALRQRLKNPSVIVKLPKIIRVMQQYVDTNLTIEEMLALVNFGQQLDSGDFQMVLLPGRFSLTDEYVASYWIIDPSRRDRVMEQYFEQAPLESRLSQDSRRSYNRIKIAVQNTTERPFLASQTVRYLRDHDFRNAYVINDSPIHLQETEIVVQQGDLDAAEFLQKVLGVGHIEAASTGDLDSDLTIRLGEDAMLLIEEEVNSIR